MAQNMTFGNSFGMPLAMERENPQPLDKTAFYTSLSAAQTFAASSPVAYVGMTLVVWGSTANENGVYQIINTSGTLAKLVDGNELGSTVSDLEAKIAAGIGNAGYQGSYTTMASKTNLEKGMVFNILTSEMTAFTTKFGSATGVEAGDWLVVKQDAVFANIGPSDFDTVFGIWEKNLTGAVIDITNDSNNHTTKTESGGVTNVEADSGYFLSSVEKNNDTLKFKASALPTVPDIVVDGGSAESGKYIASVSVDSTNKHKLNVTKGTQLHVEDNNSDNHLGGILTDNSTIKIKPPLERNIAKVKNNSTIINPFTFVITEELITANSLAIGYVDSTTSEVVLLNPHTFFTNAKYSIPVQYTSRDETYENIRKNIDVYINGIRQSGIGIGTSTVDLTFAHKLGIYPDSHPLVEDNILLDVTNNLWGCLIHLPIDFDLDADDEILVEYHYPYAIVS